MASDFDGKGALPESFIEAAKANPIRTVRTNVDLDQDVLDWLKAEFPNDWQREVNGLLRFYMDTNRMTPPDAEPNSGPAAPALRQP